MIGSPTTRARGVRANRLRLPAAWLLCSLALLGLVLLERWLLAQHTFPGDRWAAHVGMSHKPWLVFAITRVYQQVGRPLVAVGEVLAMSAWIWRAAGRRTAAGLLVALLASASCGLIKIICGPTPLWLVLSNHVGTNFPSGVVTFMTACGGYLAVVAWRQGHRIAPAVLVLAILGAGPARVIGGQHLISDVLGAYMLGAVWLIASYAFLERLSPFADLSAVPRIPAPRLRGAGGVGVEGHARLVPSVGTRAAEEPLHPVVVPFWDEQADGSPAAG